MFLYKKPQGATAFPSPEQIPLAKVLCTPVAERLADSIGELIRNKLAESKALKRVEGLQEKILVNEDGLLVPAKESFIKMASFRFHEATRALHDAIVEYERIKAAIPVSTI